MVVSRPNSFSSQMCPVRAPRESRRKTDCKQLVTLQFSLYHLDIKILKFWNSFWLQKGPILSSQETDMTDGLCGPN